MESISRFHLSVHEEGRWHVIDRETGGPVELEIDGTYRLLYGLPREEAEEWSKLLNSDPGMFGRKNPSR